MEKLLLCPACGSEIFKYFAGGRFVACENCLMTGPNNDPDGSKWNALPRNTNGKVHETVTTKTQVRPRPYQPATKWEHKVDGRYFMIVFNRKDRVTVAALYVDGFMYHATPACRHPNDAQDAKIGDRVAVKRVLANYTKPTTARILYDAFRKWQHERVELPWKPLPLSA